MNIKEIQDLIKFVARQNVTEVEIEQKDFKLTIKSENKSAEAQHIVVQAPTAIPQVAAPVAAAPVAAPAAAAQMTIPATANHGATDAAATIAASSGMAVMPAASASEPLTAPV